MRHMETKVLYIHTPYVVHVFMVLDYLTYLLGKVVRFRYATLVLDIARER